MVDTERRARLREMMVIEAVETTRAILTTDRYPHTDAVLERAERRFRRMDMRAALTEMDPLTDDEALERWREAVGRHIRHQIADLRPS